MASKSKPHAPKYATAQHQGLQQRPPQSIQERPPQAIQQGTHHHGIYHQQHQSLNSGHVAVQQQNFRPPIVMHHAPQVVHPGVYQVAQPVVHQGAYPVVHQGAYPVLHQAVQPEVVQAHAVHLGNEYEGLHG